nr:flavodoxin domain-containing protein [uncultured Methanobacterium sp.]
MNAKSILKKMGIGLVIFILLLFAVMGSIIFDAASYTGTGSEKLEANGTAVGSALVVYDPGFSGVAKNTASNISSQLQTYGYNVDVVGIRNSQATNTSNYDVIAVVGPVYMGKVASSVQEYLKTFKPAAGTKVGVFVTGSDPDTANDNALLMKEAVPLPDSSNITVKTVVKGVNADNTKTITFVNTLIK